MQIVIHSDNDEFPRLNLTTFGTREVFDSLKEVCSRLLAGGQLLSVHVSPYVQAWTKARIATAVHHGDNSDHHLHV